MLALADGVNWGQRPMWAAKAAVYGFLSHVHQELASKHGQWGYDVLYLVIICSSQSDLVALVHSRFSYISWLSYLIWLGRLCAVVSCKLMQR